MRITDKNKNKQPHFVLFLANRQNKEDKNNKNEDNRTKKRKNNEKDQI